MKSAGNRIFEISQGIYNSSELSVSPHPHPPQTAGYFWNEIIKQNLFKIQIRLLPGLGKKGRKLKSCITCPRHFYSHLKKTWLHICFFIKQYLLGIWLYARHCSKGWRYSCQEHTPSLIVFIVQRGRCIMKREM